MVLTEGRRLGAGRLTPHKVRHSSITLALDLTGGDVRRVQRLSRHASPSTLLLYGDARENHQGAITELIAARLAAR